MTREEVEMMVAAQVEKVREEHSKELTKLRRSKQPLRGSWRTWALTSASEKYLIATKTSSSTSLSKIANLLL